MQEWQLNRIRRALRLLEAEQKTHYVQERGANNAFKNISEAILDHSDVLIPPERLRQFAKGIPDRSLPSGRRFPKRFSSEEKMTALLEYLRSRSQSASVLASFDILKWDIGADAVGVMQEYARLSCDTEASIQAAQLAGSYCAEERTNDHAVTRYLTIDAPSDSGAFRAHLAFERFAKGAADWDKPDFVERYLGWGFIDPNDKIQIFLKAEVDADPMVAISYAIGIEVVEGKRPEFITVLLNQTPLIMQSSDSDKAIEAKNLYISLNTIDFKV